jgi:peptidyl-tRNA hydrolase
MGKRVRKVLAVVLSIVMAIGLLPGMNLIAKADGAVEYIKAVWNSEQKKVEYVSDSVYAYTTVEANTKLWVSGWYVVKGSNVEINERITVSGTANLILCDGATLTAKNGINVSEGDTLNIYGQENGTGTLNAIADKSSYAGIGGGIYEAGGIITIHGGTVNATSRYGGAGIGGGYERAGGKITISGGTIDATGGNYAAGIGGGDQGAGGIVTINGGNVTAKGGRDFGAGIGGGCYAAGGIVTINGGTVNATGGDLGAGIGGGNKGAGGEITISGGTVEAIGGDDGVDDGGAGIGGGYFATGGTVTINGGTVTATGGRCGAGIGGGEYEAGGTVTINGGTVTATGKDGGAGIGAGLYIAGIGAGLSDNPHGSLEITSQLNVYIIDNEQEKKILATDYAHQEKIIVRHDHVWTITKAEDGNSCVIKCIAGLCSYGTDPSYTVSISATSKNYDGERVTASLSDITKLPKEIGVSKPEYEGRDGTVYNKSVTAPSDQGKYTASVEVSTSADIKQTISVDFEISKPLPVITVSPEVLEGLDYTGSAQELITKGSADGGEMKYALGKDATTAPTSGWSTSVPTAINAGTYYVWYKVVADAYHTDIEATALAPVWILPESVTNVTVTLVNDSFTYTGSEHTVVVSSVKLCKKNFTKDDYDINGETSATEAGTYVVWLTFKGNYSGEFGAEWKIEKAASVIGKKPEVKTALTYTGSAQELITKGSVTGGEIQYALGKDATTAPTTGWGTSVPTGTKADTYYVWYKVVGDDNHTDIAATALTPVKISPKSVTDVTVTLNNNSFTYTGSKQAVTVSSVKLGEKELTKDDYDISGDTSATDAGTYTMTVTLKGNYNGTGIAKWTIEKAVSVIGKTPEAKTALTYTGSAQELITKGSITGGEMQYALGTNGTTAPANGWSTLVPAGTKADTYYVWYKVVGDANHTDIAATAITPITIAQKSGTDVTVILNSDSFTYTGSKQAVTVSSVKLGEKELKSEDYDIGGVTSATDAGTYTVTVTLKGNYSGTGTAEWNISKATPVIDNEPEDLKAVEGQKLSDIELPDGWSWIDESESVGNAGTNTFKAKYTPADTTNYNVIESIELQVEVSAAEEPEEKEEPGKTGDINGDDIINAKDVTILRRYLAGGWNVEIKEEYADVNKDGIVNAKDVTILRRYLAGGWGISLG